MFLYTLAIMNYGLIKIFVQCQDSQGQHSIKQYRFKQIDPGQTLSVIGRKMTVIGADKHIDDT